MKPDEIVLSRIESQVTDETTAKQYTDLMIKEIIDFLLDKLEDEDDDE